MIKDLKYDLTIQNIKWKSQNKSANLNSKQTGY